MANWYAFRLGLWGTGTAKASRGEGRGEPNGDAVEDLVRLKVVGTKPGGARGLTPRRGEPESGVPGPRHDAGDGRRRIVCLMGGGEVALPPPSRYRQSASRTAFSRACPVKFVFSRNKPSSLSVLSSSSMFGSCRMGRQISNVSSDTIVSVGRRMQCRVFRDCTLLGWPNQM